jgi:hypothetical protein
MATEDSRSPEILYPDWQNEYQAALVELDREKLPKRVAAAETSVYMRLQQISRGSDDQAERQAIEDALAGLRFLKKRQSGFSRLGKEVVTQLSDKADFGLCRPK